MIDTHAHYDDEQFDNDREALIASLIDNGVERFVNIGCDIPTSKFSVELANKYSFIYSAVGIHPENLKGLDGSEIEMLRDLISNNDKVVAIGEIGLDYHYDTSYNDLQKEWFEKQLVLAKEVNLPVVIHSRDATEDTITILKKYAPFPRAGVLHCFSGSWETAKIILNMGFYLGIDGPVTYKNNVKTVEVVKNAPLDRLLVETDCPYLSPEPVRGGRNDSRNLKYIIQKIADIRECSYNIIENATTENAKKFFNF